MIMKSIIICMAIELCIGIFIALLIWLKNFYQLIKYSDKYKIIKVDIQEEQSEFLENYIYDSSFNFLAIDYLFAILKYENDTITTRTFYNIFGGNITIKEQNREQQIISRYTYMYYCLVTIPILLVIFISLFGSLFFPYIKDLFNYRAWLAISAIIWSIIGFYLPMFLKYLISEFQNELQNMEEKDNSIKK